MEITPPKILFETDTLIAVEKPNGLSSVQLLKGGEPSVVDFILNHWPNQITVGEKKEDAGALFRLDRETSGVLLFAKTKDAFQFYRKRWNTDSIQKEYMLLTDRFSSDSSLFPLKKSVEIQFPIGRSNKSKQKSIAIIEEKNRIKIRGNEMPAFTKILSSEKVNHTIASEQQTTPCLKIKVSIKTGVPHQIRCHLSAINYPILGDTLYGGTPSNRLYLHCNVIEIPEFNNEDKKMRIESPCPF